MPSYLDYRDTILFSKQRMSLGPNTDTSEPRLANQAVNSRAVKSAAWDGEGIKEVCEGPGRYYICGGVFETI